MEKLTIITSCANNSIHTIVLTFDSIDKLKNNASKFSKLFLGNSYNYHQTNATTKTPTSIFSFQSLITTALTMS